MRKRRAGPTADIKRKESEPMSKILNTTVLVDIIRRKEVALDYVDSVKKAEGVPRLSMGNAVLVTSNTRHFSMIERLQLEDPY